ncbi:uncharacterized protein LOC126736000 isoform X13 [Anthonomus grandis grandis]|uniref:uncharacterized protein LOC126736000 isoform X13 n=1 Tax=Anthonomus grandis grandis TaxID=2921223 RepID=UPI0021663BB2|nr:uncharacterized protein LOC126736000 isoform X13 [Anthonomus grandis grandis]
MKFKFSGYIFLLLVLPSLNCSLSAPSEAELSCNSTIFSCGVTLETGRYSNPSDPTCKSYLYCYFSGDRILEYKYTCSFGIFNPFTRTCDISYSCHCSAYTNTTHAATSTTIVTTTTELAVPDSEPTCVFGTNFTCTVTGKYANPYDSTCGTYIHCFSWIAGHTTQHIHSCLIGLFNPITQICDSAYVCPCKYKISTISDTTSTTVATTSTSPDICAVGTSFICSQTGRYASTIDTTCKSYIYCYRYSNGTVGQFGYNCSIGLFNPSTQTCDLTYVCPCIEETTLPLTSESTTITSVSSTSSSTSSNADTCAVGSSFSCSETGRYASPIDTTCKSYIYCYRYSNGTVGQFGYNCSIGLFNPNTQSCDLTYVCPCTEETTLPLTSESTAITSVSSTSSSTSSNADTCAVGSSFSCSETGRYASPIDTTCKSYIYCYRYSNGTVGQFGYNCSIGLFNPSTQSCDLTYVCPCIEETTLPLTSESTTITSVSSTSSSTSSNADTCAVGSSFSCSETGRYASPIDTTCKSYIYCYRYSNGTVGQFGYNCSIGLFNPSTQSCDLTYVCPCIEETTLPLTSESTTITSVSSTSSSTSSNADTCAVGSSFSCSETGRYASPIDTTCKSYIYCYRYSNGTVGQFGYNCSIGLFNPSTQSCDLTYVCPCIEETTLPLTSESTTITSVSSTSSSTSSNTVTCAVGSSFSCSETGRYASPIDTTCKSYIYCYRYSNGTVGQFGYNCSIGLFNPSTQSCDLTYVCPCIEETTLPLTSESTTITSVSSTSSSTSSNADTCAVGSSFSCSETGRYASPIDTTCKSYIYCYRYSNGTVGQFGYNCSIGLFNPSTQSCDLTYVCPCIEETTLPLTSESTTITSVSSTSSSTSSNTDTCAVGSSFSCSETGRYASPIDTTCKSYIYCYRYSNGTVGQFGYNCSIGFFNPSTQSCDLTYVCPCIEETTLPLTSESTTITSVSSTISSTSSNADTCAVGSSYSCSETGRYASPIDTTCKSYIYCYRYSNGTVGQFGYNCSIGLFNPSTQSCDLTYVCPCIEETTLPLTSESTTITSVSSTSSSTSSNADTCAVGSSFSCSETGRYASPIDTTCKSYIYCYRYSNGTVGQFGYNCSIGLFNPSTQSCDLTYVCPCIEETTLPLTSESTTITSVSSTSSSTSSNADTCAVGSSFSCSETGRYASPIDTTCKSYIYCYRYSNGTVGQFGYNCSIGLFNPSTQSCDLTYVCPCIEETTLPLTSESTTITSVSSTSSSTSSNTVTCAVGSSFSCSETGRYASPIDTTCKSYIYCYRYSNGTVGQFGYNCSIGLFNPSTQSCDLTYVCPCIEETTLPLTSESTTITSVSSTSSSTSSNADTCAVGSSFSCSETGRYASPIDTTCKSYIYCYRYSNGTVGQFGYNCSIGLFNPSTQSCDLTYVCPCIEETTLPLTSESTTITSVSSTSSSTSSNADTCAVGSSFSCSETGRYASPIDTTCKSYIYCYRYSNGTVGQFGYNCSIGLFNPSTQSCDLTYVCPCREETTLPLTSESTTITSVSSTSSSTSLNTDTCAVGSGFSCSETGRYASPIDTTCKSYIYCYRYSNGTVAQFGYNCSIGLFNPSTQSCDLAYVCPCIEETILP